jgi:hypothetical protein
MYKINVVDFNDIYALCNIQIFYTISPVLTKSVKRLVMESFILGMVSA